MDGEGYIRLYWKTKDSLVGQNAIGLGLWCHILLSVAVRRKLLHNGEILEPGECIISLAKLAEADGVTRKQLDKYLRSLEADGMISVTKRDRNGTKLSVCNFKTYQPQFFQSGTQTERNGNETGTKRERKGTQTESPKSPKSKESKGATPRKTFEPPSVEEVAEYVQAKGYAIDPEAFVAHYAARNWVLSNGRRMADWKATCVTWHKNADRFGSGSNAKRKGLFE